jgi:hypothetical protein
MAPMYSVPSQPSLAGEDVDHGVHHPLVSQRWRRSFSVQLPCEKREARIGRGVGLEEPPHDLHLLQIGRVALQRGFPDGR